MQNLNDILESIFDIDELDKNIRKDAKNQHVIRFFDQYIKKYYPKLGSGPVEIDIEDVEDIENHLQDIITNQTEKRVRATTAIKRAVENKDVFICRIPGYCGMGCTQVVYQIWIPRLNDSITADCVTITTYTIKPTRGTFMRYRFHAHCDHRALKLSDLKPANYCYMFSRAGFPELVNNFKK